VNHPAVAPAVALFVSLVATPLVRRLALRLGITDMPDARRIHVRPTPRAGGIAVALAAAIGLAFAGSAAASLGVGVLAGFALLLVVGVVDDIVSLSPKKKFVAQGIAAIFAVAGGLRLGLFGAEHVIELQLLDAALTVVWIVLITNALNLTDGLDGLASGIGILSLIWLTAAQLRAGAPTAAIPALILGAALLGFLPYNFNPASIFLGDAGSLVIGYALAVLPLAGSAPVPPLAALLLVAVPATDTALAIARRFFARCLRSWGDGFFAAGIVEGLKNTTSPDRRHVHHRLIDLGFSQRRAVLMLWVAGVSTAALGYMVAGQPSFGIDVVALSLGIAVIWVVQALGFDELRPARSGLVLPVLRRLAPYRRLVVVADLALIVAAYAGSLTIIGGPRMQLGGETSAVVVMAIAQVAVFAAFGVYRTTWWMTDVGGFGLLLRACGAGTVAGYIALRLLALPAGGDAAIVHFLLLLPSVTLMRFSPVLLARVYVHAHGSGPHERALICGTTEEGQHALVRMRVNGMRGIEPVGFLELQPRLQGRWLGELPVIGTLDGLAAIATERKVKHLIVADPALGESDFRWVRAVCRQLGMRLHRYVETLEDYGDGPAATAARAGVAVTTSGAEHVAANGNGHTNGTGNGNGYANGNGNGNGSGNGNGNGHGNGNGDGNGHGNGDAHWMTSPRRADD